MRGAINWLLPGLTDAETSAADAAGLSGGRGAREGTTTEGACSFSATTVVVTPSGQRAIASLHVGDHVIAYDPTSGTTSTQTVQHVWVNHDTDLLDVTLHTADTAHPTAGTNDSKQRDVALRAHGVRAPPDDQADLAHTGTTATTAATTGATQDETVHTTANHPWLTADRGWVLAGELHRGEQIVREGGAAPATVTALRVVAGAADYYNLTISVLHTYAVGDGQYVVHNCGGTLDDAPTGDNIVYRGLARGENPADGLTARDPSADPNKVTPASHVAGKKASPWISTTKSLDIAVNSWGKHGVVAIDLSKVDSQILDISSGMPGREGQMINNWAQKYREVLILRSVPAEAIPWSWRP